MSDIMGKTKVGYMVKYKNRGKWIVYFGEGSEYDIYQLVYDNLEIAQTYEILIKRRTKRTTKIFKVVVMPMVHEIDEIYEKYWLKFFKKKGEENG